ncbi:alpha/beta fold hydrolase [Nonomuraea diastatica]|nr:alpha/beta fold hydrolase [Nonomuraea diastatica]
MRKYFDLVSLDLRGVGRSTPVRCSADVVDQSPLTYPENEAEYQAWLAYNARLSKDCREHTGAAIDHVHTTNAARDIDTIRAVLGERQISFFALSYGTQVGHQYAELFPGRLRAMAIDSNMDHSITSVFRYLAIPRRRARRPPASRRPSTTPTRPSGALTGSGKSAASRSSTSTASGWSGSTRTPSCRRSGPTCWPA